MSTYLGVFSLLSADDLDEVASPTVRCSTWRATCSIATTPRRRSDAPAAVSHEAGRKVSLTLSDSFCVDRHRHDFAALVRDEVDILFGNGDELCSLYELDSLDDAIARVRTECELAAITAGPEGSSSCPPTSVVRARPSRSPTCSTRPVRVTSTRRGSCTGTRVAVPLDGVRADRLHRCRRGDQPRRAEAPRRAAYAAAVTSGRERPTGPGTAERWLAAEPDDDIRAGAAGAARRSGTTSWPQRFDGRLMFGTAGLAAIGAGPLRMNRLVVRQAARGSRRVRARARSPTAAQRESSSATTPAARATSSPSTRRACMGRGAGMRVPPRCRRRAGAEHPGVECGHGARVPPPV